MVIIFLSKVDTDDGVGVYHLLCRPVSDREGPQIPSLMCLPALCASVLEMLMRGVKITTTSASIYLMSNVNWLRGGQLLFGVTVNVDNVAMGLGLNLERSIYYLDLEPLAFLHGVRPVLTLWSGACQHSCSWLKHKMGAGKWSGHFLTRTNNEWSLPLHYIHIHVLVEEFALYLAPSLDLPLECRIPKRCRLLYRNYS